MSDAGDSVTATAVAGPAACTSLAVPAMPGETELSVAVIVAVPIVVDAVTVAV